MASLGKKSQRTAPLLCFLPFFFFAKSLFFACSK